MHSRRVLVVDDDAVWLRLFERWLTSGGFRPFLAARGQQALTLAARISPHLILLDLHLGGLNGVEVCRRLKQWPATARIPVILITGLKVPEDLLDCARRELGCGRVWRKDQDPEELLGRIRRILRANCGCGRARAPLHEKPSYDASAILRRGLVTVDLAARRVWLGGREIERLPARRFELFCALIRRHAPISRAELGLELWGTDESPKTVQMSIMRLRRDLAAQGLHCIKTSPHGYRIDLGDE